MAESTRSLTDLFGMLGVRKAGETGAVAETSVTNVAEAAYATKALQKFLNNLQGNANPLLLDLGPVVGSNVTFFGEQLGCRIRVEDIAADIDRHVKNNTLEKLPEFFNKRFTEPPGTVDDRRQRGPALELKKLSSRWNFLGGRVGSLDEGAGAQRQRSGGARGIVREIPPTTKPCGA